MSDDKNTLKEESEETDKKTIKEELEETEEEIRKLEEDKKEKGEKQKLAEEEELPTRSKILQRPLLEDYRRTLPPAEPTAAAREMPSFGSARMWGFTGTTGTVFSPDSTRVRATSIGGIITEIFATRFERQLTEKMESGRGTAADMYKRMWAMSLLRRVDSEDRMAQLMGLEKSSKRRMDRMVSLQLTKADGGLTEDQTRELDELQDAEARRYQLREQLLSKMSAKKQKELGWVEPIADGAVGIMPYTYMTSWSMLPKDMRKAARWYFDNVLLRWQGAVMGQYQPRAPRLTWYKKQKQKGVEQLFDDIDEEIYFDKKWQEQVKKGTARLDDLEEELTGYDRFTVEEEEKIKKLVDQYIASEISRIQDEDLST